MHDFEFYQQQERIFGQTLKPYSHCAPEGRRRMVLSGFPYDEGTRRNGGRIGGSVGSKIFRQTLGKLQIYPKHTVEVLDAGDIEEDLQLEEAHKLLEEKHTRILAEGKDSLLVSVGGSNDQSYPNAAALLSNYFPHKIAVVNLDSHFDVRPLKEGKAHSGSPFRLLLEDSRFRDSGSVFVEFGAKGASCSNAHWEYLREKGCEVIWMEKTIRRFETRGESRYRTQGGQAFEALMGRLHGEVEAVFVSFDLDVISSKWMPGVSAPSVIGGLDSLEALEIVQIAGLSPKVRLVDFSEFNPAAESVLSSHLLVELFFNLSESFAVRGSDA